MFHSIFIFILAREISSEKKELEQLSYIHSRLNSIHHQYVLEPDFEKRTRNLVEVHNEIYGFDLYPFSKLYSLIKRQKSGVQYLIIPNSIYGNSVSSYYPGITKKILDRYNINEQFVLSKNYVLFDTHIQTLTDEKEIVKYLLQLVDLVYTLYFKYNVSIMDISNCIYFYKPTKEIKILFSNKHIKIDKSNNQLLESKNRLSILYLIDIVLMYGDLLPRDMASYSSLKNIFSHFKNKQSSASHSTIMQILLENILASYGSISKEKFNVNKYKLVYYMSMLFDESKRDKHSKELLSSFIPINRPVTFKNTIYDLYPIMKENNHHQFRSISAKKSNYPRNKYDTIIPISKKELDLESFVIFNDINKIYSILSKQNSFFIPILIIQYNDNSMYHFLDPKQQDLKTSIKYLTNDVEKIQNLFKFSFRHEKNLQSHVNIMKFFDMLHTLIEFDKHGLNIAPLYGIRKDFTDFSIIPLFSDINLKSDVLATIFVQLLWTQKYYTLVSTIEESVLKFNEVEYSFYCALSDRHYHRIDNLLVRVLSTFT